MNFKHEIRVKKESDGTFTGLPDEWLNVLCEQVKLDKESGDDAAAETGQKVLRFFQEFSRDGSRGKKPLLSPTNNTASQKKRLPPLSPSHQKKNHSVFYLDLENGDKVPRCDSKKCRNSRKQLMRKGSSSLQKSHPSLLTPEREKSCEHNNASSNNIADDDGYDIIELTDAQKAMAETILELKKGFGESKRALKAPSVPRKPPTTTKDPPPPLPAPKQRSSQVRLRNMPSASEKCPPQMLGSGAFAKYRNISLYNSGQALEEMKRLCNQKPIYEVYNMGKKLGSGSGGTVVLATDREDGQRRAVKTIDLRSGEKKRHLLMEVLVMKELTHKNLVAFKDIFLSSG